MTLKSRKPAKQDHPEEKLTPEQKIKAALKLNLSAVVNHYILDNDITRAAAREHERELRRYLAMCAINPKKRYGMRGPVDDLWHTFLFFTIPYMRFCRRVGGYIHHKYSSFTIASSISYGSNGSLK